MGGKLCKCAVTGNGSIIESRAMSSLENRSRYSDKAIELDYIIQSETVLGTGYNGPVVLGVNRHTMHESAIKRFDKKGVEKKKLDFLRAEVNIYLQVDHPHIARLLHVYEEEHCLSLVMERCIGNEMYYRLKTKKAFSEREAQTACYQMCLAVAYLHRHHIVHCDIKLENWLYESEEDNAKLKLIDFGFSKIWDEREGSMHQSCGSLAYVAPEVLKQDYTNKCDMWSLGVIVFMLLGGYPPFHGKDTNALIANINSCSYCFRRDKWEHTTEWARDFVTKLLVIQPQARLSAVDALQHPWMHQIDEELNLEEDRRYLSPVLLDDLRRYARGSHFKHLALSIMAHHITSPDLEEIRNSFLALDTDKSGTITFDNLRDAIHGQFDLSEPELKEIFECINMNHDQEIHYSEFIAALMQTRVHMDQNLLRETFDHLDVFHSGIITKKDLRSLIGSNKFEDTDLNALMSECKGCTPKSGISFEKFSEHLQSIDSVSSSDSMMKSASPSRCRSAQSSPSPNGRGSSPWPNFSLKSRSRESSVAEDDPLSPNSHPSRPQRVGRTNEVSSMLAKAGAGASTSSSKAEVLSPVVVPGDARNATKSSWSRFGLVDKHASSTAAGGPEGALKPGFKPPPRGEMTPIVDDEQREWAETSPHLRSAVAPSAAGFALPVPELPHGHQDGLADHSDEAAADPAKCMISM